MTNDRVTIVILLRDEADLTTGSVAQVLAHFDHYGVTPRVVVFVGDLAGLARSIIEEIKR